MMELSRNAVLTQTALPSHPDSDIPEPRAFGNLLPVGDPFRSLLLFGRAERRMSPAEATIYDIRETKWSQVPFAGDVGPRFGAAAAHCPGGIGRPSLQRPFNLILGGFIPSDNEAETFAPLVDVPSNFERLRCEATGKVLTITCELDRHPKEVVATEISSCSLVQCRGFAAAVFVPPHNIYLHGGITSLDATNVLCDLICINIEDCTTVAVEQNLELPRWGHSLIYDEVRNSLVLLGGEQWLSFSPSRLALGTFVEGNVRWDFPDVQGSPMLERRLHSVAHIGGRTILVMGGATATATISDSICLDLTDMKWSKPLYEEPQTSRGACESGAMGKLLSFGGVMANEDGTFVSGAATCVASVLYVKPTSKKSRGAFTFKLVTIGESGVGKTCMLQRFCHDLYSEAHIATIGTDLKVLRTMIKGKLLSLHLWDTAGQERYTQLTSSYARDADGVLVIYDATSRHSFEQIEKQWLPWLNEVRDSAHETRGDTILVGNKYDADFECIQVTVEEGADLAKRVGMKFFACSAKTSLNVDAAIMSIARELANRQTDRLNNVTGIQIAPVKVENNPCCVGG